MAAFDTAEVVLPNPQPTALPNGVVDGGSGLGTPCDLEPSEGGMTCNAVSQVWSVSGYVREEGRKEGNEARSSRTI